MPGGDHSHKQHTEAQKMTTQAAESDDLTKLDDDQLIGQRAALRQRLQQMPEHHIQRASLVVRYGVLTDEFDRRARAAWQPAETEPGNTRQRVETDSAGQQP
jgi:hypothetical protein